jgi:glycosyltransferase involved in cell wall biosynthesis
MAKELKSAWELASERVIASPERKIEPVDNNEYNPEDIDEGPIFQYGDMDISSVNTRNMEFVNDEMTIPTELLPTDPLVIQQMREEREAQEQQESTENEEIKVVQPETIHYGDDSNESTLEIKWTGNFYDYGGFARMNRSMVFGLSNRNIKLKVDPYTYLDHINKATKEQIKRMSKERVADDSPHIYGCTVPIDFLGGGRNILYTMIENSGQAHEDYIGKLNMMDEIWVATEFGKRQLQQSGVHPPIYTMPLGVDAARYMNNQDALDFGDEIRDFTFLSVFRWSYRKGWDILLRAYLEEFSNDEDVSLVLVSRVMESPEENGTDQIINDLNGIIDTVHRPEEDLPHIALYSEPIPEKDMPKVYRAADAFTLFSRGEGFGLPYIEAASCGLPVIGTNCSGQSDFLDHDNSYLVEPEGFVKANISGEMHQMAKLCRFYENQEFPRFGTSSVLEARRLMRHVYENQSEAQEKARKLQNFVVNNYTWDMAIDRVYNRIMEIGEQS